MITETVSKDRSVIFFANDEEIKAFDDVAWKLRMNRSELLRQCVREKIAEHTTNQGA